MSTVNLYESVKGVTSHQQRLLRQQCFLLQYQAFIVTGESRGDVDGSVWVGLNPGSGGHVAHEVLQHEDLMLANGL